MRQLQFQPSQSAQNPCPPNAKCTMTGQQVPFVLKPYQRPGQLIVDDSTSQTLTTSQHVHKGNIGLAAAIIGGALLIPTFVVYPLVIGAFKPEWGYGRKVLAGIGISMALSAVAGVARAAAK